ncbi:hypothetical protein MKZ38_002724 [Zalerion maritima]|uniref:Uncharacterized protein n=1 Tax=Zalerion maritima TaxID=339359 RepID=A0AAD5WQM0_9PEZI|nr:hypothetical protein MKZ38_002724 [Zalerion maritima]
MYFQAILLSILPIFTPPSSADSIPEEWNATAESYSVLTEPVEGSNKTRCLKAQPFIYRYGRQSHLQEYIDELSSSDRASAPCRPGDVAFTRFPTEEEGTARYTSVRSGDKSSGESDTSVPCSAIAEALSGFVGIDAVCAAEDADGGGGPLDEGEKLIGGLTVPEGNENHTVMVSGGICDEDLIRTGGCFGAEQEL